MKHIKWKYLVKHLKMEVDQDITNQIGMESTLTRTNTSDICFHYFVRNGIKRPNKASSTPTVAMLLP